MGNLIKSMTGYGKGEFTNNLYKIKVEIKSVNHRYNDVFIKMPRHIQYLEEKVKKAIKEKISRGKVDVYINLENIKGDDMDIKVDINLAKTYKLALDDLKENLEINDSIRIGNILSMSDVIKIEKRELDEDALLEALDYSLKIAIDDISTMREQEGMSLKNDMLDKIINIESYIDKIEVRAPLVVIEYKDKLRDRIKELLDKNIVLDEERLSNEVAFFADKSSIDEELVRLKSHIIQFKKIIEEDIVGRKLDFLIQEFNREVNTIGSKANDIIISNQVVELKSELEKIREQIQNIE